MLPEELILIIASYLKSSDIEASEILPDIFNVNITNLYRKLYAWNFPIFFDKILKSNILVSDWKELYVNALMILEDPKTTNNFWKRYLTTGIINPKLCMCRKHTRYNKSKNYELFNIPIIYYEILISKLYPLINIKLLNKLGISTQELSLIRYCKGILRLNHIWKIVNIVGQSIL